MIPSDELASRRETVLITGATGFLGRELVQHLLVRYPSLHLVALVRAADDAALAARRSALADGLAPHEEARLHAVRGDTTAPQLGLTGHDRDAALERVERVIHCAASIRFDLPLDRARRENVEGTRSVLDLCRALRARGRSGRLDHVSTAFVAGTRAGLVGEEELFVASGLPQHLRADQV